MPFQYPFVHLGLMRETLSGTPASLVRADCLASCIPLGLLDCPAPSRTFFCHQIFLSHFLSFRSFFCPYLSDKSPCLGCFVNEPDKHGSCPSTVPRAHFLILPASSSSTSSSSSTPQSPPKVGPPRLRLRSRPGHGRQTEPGPPSPLQHTTKQTSPRWPRRKRWPTSAAGLPKIAAKNPPDCKSDQKRPCARNPSYGFQEVIEHRGPNVKLACVSVVSQSRLLHLVFPLKFQISNLELAHPWVLVFKSAQPSVSPLHALTPARIMPP